MYLSQFVIPKGTKVRQLKPSECPTGIYWVVVTPRDIPEYHTNPILRHDLTHQFAFVPSELCV